MPKLNKYGELIAERGGKPRQSSSQSVSSSTERVSFPAGSSGTRSSSSPVIAFFFVLLVIGAIVFVVVRQHEGNRGPQLSTLPEPSTVVPQAVAWPSDSESLAPNSFVAAVNGQVEGVVFYESAAENVPKPSRAYA